MRGRFRRADTPVRHAAQPHDRTCKRACGPWRTGVSAHGNRGTPRISSVDAIEQARSLLASAKRAAVFTGAGVSADSGVPTFRGSSADALWGKYSPQQLASPQGFKSDPTLVYEWYTWRRSQLAKVQ